MTRFATRFGAFEIDSLPGQCQVAVCHSFVVPEDHRGNGHGHHLKAEQEALLDHHHYDFAVCTVAAGNERQKRILEKSGWRHLANFRNRRSCETTELWCRGATPSTTEDSHHE